jgi:hypothetical protein
MTKEIQLNIRLDQQTLKDLNELCELDLRSRNNMIDWLIRKEIQRRFVDQPDQENRKEPFQDSGR